MKLALALAAALLAATPVAAQVSPSVEVSGSGRSFQNVTPGVLLGLEAPASTNTRIGAQLGLERGGTFSVGVVPSVRLAGATSLYGNAALLLRNDNLGYRIGAGIKQGLTDNTYLKVGVRRDDYGRRDTTEGTVALGLRF